MVLHSAETSRQKSIGVKLKLCPRVRCVYSGHNSIIRPAAALLGPVMQLRQPLRGSCMFPVYCPLDGTLPLLQVGAQCHVTRY